MQIEIGPNLATFMASLVPVLMTLVAGWITYRKLQATADQTQKLVNGAASTLAEKAKADQVRAASQDKEISELKDKLVTKADEIKLKDSEIEALKTSLKG